ncbi:TSI2 [Auxenochlorella protothecoides x Auxenochlorella symbiontica]
MAGAPTCGLQDVKEGKDYHFPTEEEAVLAFWTEIDAFRAQLERTKGSPEYSFYDGPPFATGLPHYGHLLAGTLKDIVTRYAACTGHHVERRFGWDCHGLPVEHEIDKQLNITTRDDVLAIGIDTYNEACRAIVMRYSGEWEKVVTRMGRWIDFRNDYKTMDPSFMESVWYAFKQLFDKGLVYRGFKVMPYSTGLSTPLSNFEAGQNYKDVSDPCVSVAFPLDGDEEGAALVAWTTTPWTLPSNLALCVHPTLEYVRVRDPASGQVYIVLESRLSEIPGALPPKAGAKKKKDAGEGAAAPAGFQVLARFPGAELAGRTYAPLFPYFAHLKQHGAFKVNVDTYVTADSGTGVVHQAPAFGEEDYCVCLASGVISKGEDLPCPVDAAGRFTAEVTDFAGQYVKDADRGIIKWLKEAGRLVDQGQLVHSYPFCWRSDTPLLYKAVPSWFVRVEEIKDRLLANNRQTSWVPAFVQEKRFHNWLENARDWAISRSRFWGTPLPIWVSEDFSEVVVIGSIDELEARTGEKVTDLHRHFIDHLTIPAADGRGVLRRVDEVFDCWFESGSMPYAQKHYPFENRDTFAATFPADFVSEGLDQTRGWFYTLMVLSTALFDKPAFKNLICSGLVLAADGKKMSKRLKNYPDPMEVVHKYGADALRLYLINSPVVRAETLKFREDGVFGVVKDVFLPWYNAYRFLVQNVRRWEGETGEAFNPASHDYGAASGSTNVLDRWIRAATRSLAAYVHAEMGAYRLYTVVPYLVRFIDDLTNVYVRLNRRRLKGRGGTRDAGQALAVLFDVLLDVCSIMSPFTPFFTEAMYGNLRRALGPDAPVSIHLRDLPKAQDAQEGDAQIQDSVRRMTTVVELARTIRDRHARGVKVPVARLTVVHPDADFLADISGPLSAYVAEECNARALEVCADPLRFCSLSAAPEWGVLGRRLGKRMGAVAAGVAALTQDQILAFELEGEVVVAGERLGPGDVKIVRSFRGRAAPADGGAPAEDAAGDGEVLVVLDLASDAALEGAGLAREAVNRVQRLRKKAGLQAGDPVQVVLCLRGAGEAEERLRAALRAEADAVADALGRAVRLEQVPATGVLAREEQSLRVGDADVAFELALLPDP